MIFAAAFFFENVLKKICCVIFAATFFLRTFSKNIWVPYFWGLVGLGTVLLGAGGTGYRTFGALGSKLRNPITLEGTKGVPPSI